MRTVDRRSFVVGAVAMVPLAALGCSDEDACRLHAIQQMANDAIDEALWPETQPQFVAMGYCADCINFRTRRMGTVWYDRFCGRVENGKVKHPVTGELTYIPGYNALGQTIYSDQQYPYARDLNGRGQCKNFEAKP